jgi:hypothetical protein
MLKWIYNIHMFYLTACQQILLYSAGIYIRWRLINVLEKMERGRSSLIGSTKQNTPVRTEENHVNQYIQPPGRKLKVGPLEYKAKVRLTHPPRLAYRTPRSRILLQKLIVPPPVKKFPVFYAGRKFITVTRPVRHITPIIIKHHAIFIFSI